MKKITRILLLLLVLLLPVQALARQRVYDYDMQLTAAEKQQITDAADAFVEQTGMDYGVVIINQEIGSQSHHEIAREYYYSLDFGLGDDASGVLYYLNMNENNRYEYLYTDGAMIDYMTDERIESALDQSNPLLRQGLYKEGALAMIEAVLSFVNKGIPEGQYRYDVVTGEILTARHKVLTVPEMLIGAGICLLIGIAFIWMVSSRYKLKGSTYRYDYSANSDLTMTENTDQYIRTTVTRTRRAQSSGGSGGGGGFGGGSGVHSGGGGGGGRSF